MFPPFSQPEVTWRQFPRYPKQPLQALIPRAPLEAIDLLEHLLAFEPSSRLSAHEALLHPYFTGGGGGGSAAPAGNGAVAANANLAMGMTAQQSQVSRRAAGRHEGSGKGN